MAQSAPTPFKLTKLQTAQVLAALEARKYGCRLNAEELAQKANVDLDSVNRLEQHLPIDDPALTERIANALVITTELLKKIGGTADISPDEWRALQTCLQTPPDEQGASEQCERVGLRPIRR